MDRDDVSLLAEEIIEQGYERAAVETIELTTETISTIRDWFRAQTKLWSQMTQGEQSGKLYDIERLVASMVQRMVRVIAADGRKVIVATCAKVAFEQKGVVASFVAKSDSEYRHDLADSRGLDCLIVVADAKAYDSGERPSADAPKDNQPELPLESDDAPSVFDNTACGRGD